MELLTAANVRVPSLGTLLKLLPTVIIPNKDVISVHRFKYDIKCDLLIEFPRDESQKKATSKPAR